MQSATSSPAEPEETCSKRRKLDDKPCGWYDLPVELMAIILSWHGDKHHLLTVIVCRFVCRQWRDMLPLASSLWPKALENELLLIKAGEFDFAETASSAGHLGLVAWAMQNGCPLTRATFLSSARKRGIHWGCTIRKYAGLHVVVQPWLPHVQLSCVLYSCVRRTHSGVGMDEGAWSVGS